MVAWYIVEERHLDLNKERLFKYALAHDLVEAYAGDTVSITSDDGTMRQKAVREHEASLRIQQEFPQFEELHNFIQAYEQKADKESKFVYVLDKVLPAINEYLTGSKWYIEQNISYDTYRDWALEKMHRAGYDAVEDGGILDEILEFFKHHHEMFDHGNKEPAFPAGESNQADIQYK